MNAQFRVGEIAVVRASFFTRLIGTECDVIGLIDPIVLDGVEHRYRVLCVDGKEYLAGNAHLQKKRPPTVFSGERQIMQLFDHDLTKIAQPVEALV